MAETRKLAAILAADVVGDSRLAGADEDRTLARLRALRSDLIDPTIALHNGRLVKRTGDAASSCFEALSARCVAPSKCRTAWSSAMQACVFVRRPGPTLSRSRNSRDQMRLDFGESAVHPKPDIPRAFMSAGPKLLPRPNVACSLTSRQALRKGVTVPAVG